MKSSVCPWALHPLVLLLEAVVCKVMPAALPTPKPLRGYSGALECLGDTNLAGLVTRSASLRCIRPAEGDVLVAARDTGMGYKLG